MLEQYEVEGQKYLQKLEDRFLGIGSFDPLQDLWDSPEGETFWEEDDWWESDPEIQQATKTESQELSVQTATQQQMEMSDIGVPGALVAQEVGDTLSDINRWFKRYENGHIPEDALMNVEGFGFARPDVGYALQAMKRAAAKSGVNLSGGGYRSYEQQAGLWNGGKNGMAAPPGKSNHGWGIAIDFTGADWNTPVYKWLVANAGKFGFAHPSWAQADGSKPEPWHWEYVGGGNVKGIYKKRTVKRKPREISAERPSTQDILQSENPLTGGNAFTAAVLSMATHQLAPEGSKRVRHEFMFEGAKPKTREEIIATAKAMASAYGWTGKQWQALRWVVEGRGSVPAESNWDPTALNDETGATGIPQLNPNSHEIPKNWKNPVTQIRWLLSYVAGRYGTPEQAWRHRQETGWY